MQKLLLFVFLAGCGGPSTPSTSATTAPSATTAAPKSWDEMSHGERLDVMKKVVAPKLGADFKEFDSKRYENFSCVTCHGERIKNGDAKMPNPDLPHLSYTDGFKKHMTEKPAVTKFMQEKVVPDMAAAVGEKPYDPQTKQGFGCGECHVVGP